MQCKKLILGNHTITELLWQMSEVNHTTQLWSHEDAAQSLQLHDSLYPMALLRPWHFCVLWRWPMLSQVLILTNRLEHFQRHYSMINIRNRKPGGAQVPAKVPQESIQQCSNNERHLKSSPDPIINSLKIYLMGDKTTENCKHSNNQMH